MSCIPNITQYSVSVRYVTVLVKEFHMLNSSSECVVIGIMSQALYKYGVLACFHFPGSHGRHSPQSLRQKVNRRTKGWPLFPQWPLRPQICCRSMCVCVILLWMAPSGQHLYPPICAYLFIHTQYHAVVFLFLSLRWLFPCGLVKCMCMTRGKMNRMSMTSPDTPHPPRISMTCRPPAPSTINR